MKTSKPKPDGLSLNQRLIWHYVTASNHSLNTIAIRSGYSEQGIKNWMHGVFEPKQATVDDLTATIDMLKGEQAMTVDWSLRKPELEALKAENKSVRQISEIMGTSMCAIQHAVTRFRLTG